MKKIFSLFAGFCMLGNVFAAPVGSLRFSVWSFEKGSIWGKDRIVDANNPTEKEALCVELMNDIQSKIDEKNLVLDNNQKQALSFLIREGVAFWWDPELLEKAPQFFGACKIEFKLLQLGTKKEAVVSEGLAQNLSYKMYAYYAQEIEEVQ